MSAAPPPSSTPVVSQDPTVASTPVTSPADQNVSFTNPLIENAIRAALKLGTDDEITVDDLEYIEILDIKGSFNDDSFCSVRFASMHISAQGEYEETGVTSFTLDDLVQFPNLLTIRLENCSYIESYEPLGEILSAERIEISRCEIIATGKQLPSFEKLVNLSVLELQFLDIESLPQFEDNEKLIDISVYLCESFDDLSNIATLQGLRSLGVYKTQLSDVSPLLELSGLDKVTLSKNAISDESLLEQIDSKEVYFEK